MTNWDEHGYAINDDDEYDDYGDEYVDDDVYSEDETITGPCPNCGTDVYEDAEQCPVCGEFIIRNSSALAGRPNWFVILGVIGILAVIFTLTLGM